MKKHFLLLLLVLGYALGNGQSTDWKQINTPHRQSVLLTFQSSEGLLFGRMTTNNELVISSDNGENWTKITNVKASYFSYYNNNLPFVENKNGEVYYFDKNLVYFVNKTNLTFEIFITLNNSQSIDDLAFLANGDILISEYNNLHLYSKTGNFKKTRKWNTDSSKILPTQDGSDKNYIVQNWGTTYNLYEFSSDLNYLSFKNPLPSRLTTRYKDRLISGNKYSDNGGNSWIQTLNLNIVGINNINISNNDKIYYLGFSELYISEDGGQSVELQNYGINNIDYISSSKDNKLVVGFGSICYSKIYISNDNGLNFHLIKNDIGDYFAEKIIPGTDENLYTNTCYSLQKSNDLKNWDYIKLKSPFGDSLYAFVNLHLSNSEIIAFADYYNLFKSSDNGITWSYINSDLYYRDPFFDHFIKEKNGILYHVDYDSLHVSYDFGNTWQKKWFASDLITTYYTKIDFSEDGDIYFKDLHSINNSLYKYNFADQKLNLINDNLLDYETSFKGNELYLLSRNNSSGALILKTSSDEGQNFLENHICYCPFNGYYKLKTDHLGNIYVYSESIVLMSSNQGATWQNITPDFPELVSINDLQISYDNYIYLATNGKGILKYNVQLSEPKILTVSLYDDVNKNCQKDVNEGALNYGKIVVNDNYVKAVDANGEATFYVIKDQNTVSVQFNDKIYDYCESSYDVDMSTGINSIAIPLKTKKYCADLVTSISTPFLRRCFDNTYYGQVCNEGNIDAEETEVKIILDDYFDLIQANLPQLSHVGNELTLDAGTIKPGECKNINFTINLSCDATLGQEHCVIIDSESRSQSCNSIETRTEYTECQDNIGSFDPNDKAIFVNGVRNQTYLEPGDKLEYMIRFQNTGTDTAFTVKIQDPISTKFDVASMRPVASSHDYAWSIDNGTLNVVFNQIMLVDSFKNEPASHGFIKFEITLDEKTMLNEEVSNIAGIYFDFNEPIITNEVVTPVGKPVFTNDWSVSPFFIYPNPTTDFLSLGINDVQFNTGKVNIFDQKGGKLITLDFNVGLSNRINVSQLPSGFYILQVINNNSEFKTKFVKL